MPSWLSGFTDDICLLAQDKPPHNDFMKLKYRHGATFDMLSFKRRPLDDPFFTDLPKAEQKTWEAAHLAGVYHVIHCCLEFNGKTYFGVGDEMCQAANVAAHEALNDICQQIEAEVLLNALPSVSEEAAFGSENNVHSIHSGSSLSGLQQMSLSKNPQSLQGKIDRSHNQQHGDAVFTKPGASRSFGTGDSIVSLDNGTELPTVDHALVDMDIEPEVENDQELNLVSEEMELASDDGVEIMEIAGPIEDDAHRTDSTSGLSISADQLEHGVLPDNFVGSNVSPKCSTNTSAAESQSTSGPKHCGHCDGDKPLVFQLDSGETVVVLPAHLSQGQPRPPVSAASSSKTVPPINEQQRCSKSPIENISGSEITASVPCCTELQQSVDPAKIRAHVSAYDCPLPSFSKNKQTLNKGKQLSKVQVSPQSELQDNDAVVESADGLNQPTSQSRTIPVNSIDIVQRELQKLWKSTVTAPSIAVNKAGSEGAQVKQKKKKFTQKKKKFAPITVTDKPPPMDVQGQPLITVPNKNALLVNLLLQQQQLQQQQLVNQSVAAYENTLLGLEPFSVQRTVPMFVNSTMADASLLADSLQGAGLQVPLPGAIIPQTFPSVADVNFNALLMSGQLLPFL